jgi:hypothetical protein
VTLDANANRIDDMALLRAVVALTARRVNVPAARAFEHAFGRAPGRGDALALRLAVLRLERDGLLISDVGLHLEATPDGHVAADLLAARERDDGRGRGRRAG